jgi:hypothetical protein
MFLITALHEKIDSDLFGKAEKSLIEKNYLDEWFAQYIGKY